MQELANAEVQKRMKKVILDWLNLPARTSWNTQSMKIRRKSIPFQSFEQILVPMTI